MSTYVMPEIFVPRHESNHGALLRFYGAIGWKVWHDSESSFLLYIEPLAESCVASYWLTTNPDTISSFSPRKPEADVPDFGNQDVLHDVATTEIVFVIALEQDAQNVWDKGSRVLATRPFTVPPLSLIHI